MEECSVAIPDKYLKVLKIIINKIGNKNIVWALSGSISLALQGIEVTINDIDILTNEHGAKELDNLLKEYCVQKSEYSSTEICRSIYGKYEINNIAVEIMANYQYKLKTGEWSKLNNLNDIIMYSYKGMRIRALTLKQRLQEYEDAGKENRALKIKEKLKR